MINQRYIIRKKLGEGRSKVFSVIDTEFPEKEIAMKILPQDVTGEELNFFRQEYFTLKKLDHPNIIKSYDIGTILYVDEPDENIIPGSAYITLEKFDSVELLYYPELKNEEKLISIIKQICSALFYLHQSNYIYYDLKPQNILVSINGNSPVVKLIDMGFAKYILSEYDDKIRGTAEYIAPELLKKETHDHSVDLYSLGMILYQIIYEKFPFTSVSEIDIYKAQIEQEFNFPSADYSEKLINTVKNLLKKNSNERYQDALKVLSDLGVEIDLQLTKDFLPAKVLSGRKDVLNIIQTYLNDKKSNEIFSIRGFSGAGKSQVISELRFIYPNSVFIENSRRKSGIELIRFFLHKLLFDKEIFSSISTEDQEFIIQLFSTEEIELSDQLKAFLTRVTENKKFLLMIDDYNLYDNFAVESINEILQILQINRVKIIVAESSEFDYATGKLFNVRDINLTPFTERQLSEFLDLSYFTNFPKHKLRKVILDYADLLPGSVVQFIKDILILGVMRYTSDEINFVYEENIEEALRGSNEEVYRLRLSNLSEEELKTARLISAFDISVEQMVLASILNKTTKETEEILLNLQYKNIINSLSLSNSPNIISDSFKRYIYNTIPDKKKYHLFIASMIRRTLPSFNIPEHARQYRLAGDFLRVVELVNKEIKKAENLSAYSYKRKLIEDLLILDLSEDIKITLTVELIKTLHKISDFNSAINWLEKIDVDTLDEKSKKELLFIKGSSFISLRKIDEGIEILNDLLKTGKEQSTRQKIMVEIAYADFDKGNYKEAENLAIEVLGNSVVSEEEKGRCYNLLGMIKVYAEEDLQSAIDYFTKARDEYQKAQLPRRVSGIDVNLGSIYVMIGNYSEAECCWDNALRINTSIGNLEQEAILLMNSGIYYFYKLNFEKAIKSINRSELIFSSLGNDNYRAMLLKNLGEIYLTCCEYQKSFECLDTARVLFDRLNNFDELADTFFILSKFAFIIPDNNLFNKFFYEFEKVANKNELSLKNILNYSVMKLLGDLLLRNKFDLSKFNDIKNEFILNNDKREFYELFILTVNHLLDNEIYEEKILEVIFIENILKSKEENYLLNAYLEYFSGKIAIKIKNERLSPPIEHFEKAFSIIENEVITELTWRVLLAISESYLERGFFNKAKKPLIYAAELLNFIADNIKKSDFRTKYLNNKERQRVFELLKSFNQPVHM